MKLDTNYSYEEMTKVYNKVDLRKQNKKIRNQRYYQKRKMLKLEKSMKTSSSENDQCESKINTNNTDMVYKDDFSDCETLGNTNDNIQSTFPTTVH